MLGHITEQVVVMSDQALEERIAEACTKVESLRLLGALAGAFDSALAPRDELHALSAACCLAVRSLMLPPGVGKRDPS